MKRAIAIDHLEYTQITCPDPVGVLRQEDRYLDVLRGVVEANVYGDQLWLETEDGRALVFRAPETE